jgi:hypothetical protein
MKPIKCRSYISDTAAKDKAPIIFDWRFEQNFILFLCLLTGAAQFKGFSHLYYTSLNDTT